ncbi:MAG TPA: DUF6734 family protein [Chloroflexota bacterium]|jgi:hypothetical protein
MLAVWSFWTKPFRHHHHRVWASEKHHLLAWVLSVETARPHFERTVLITDDEGARMLIDGVGLRFDQVWPLLNVLDDEDPLWWSLGKLFAYRAQTEPFVHIDSDCFLWKPLPARMLEADVLAQSPERFDWGGGSYYHPEALPPVIAAERGWLPDALAWYLSIQGNAALNCGVFGGNNLEFIRGYADQAIHMVQHPANREVWRHFGDRISENLIAEQYLLAACIDDARARGVGLDVQYLFESTDRAFEPGLAARAGFTHLIGLAKADPDLARRLDRRIRHDYPEYYARCAAYRNRTLQEVG